MKDNRKPWTYKGYTIKPNCISALGQTYGQTSDHQDIPDAKGGTKSCARWWEIDFRDEDEQPRTAMCIDKAACKAAIDAISQANAEWEKDYTQGGKYPSVIRYVVTRLGKDGNREFFDPRQGRYTYETRAQAQARADAFLGEPTNDPDLIRGLRADPCLCWAGHFDPRRLMPVYSDRIEGLCKLV